MGLDEIIVLIISIALSTGISILLKKLLKDKFNGLIWSIPILTILGYVMMWFTSDSDTILLMLKDVFLCTFIGFMFFVNFYCIVKGAKSRKEHGKTFWTDIKSEYKNVAGTFKKKKNVEQNKEERDDNSNHG